MVVGLAGGAVSQPSGEWSSLQGGAAHPGVATGLAPSPPLRLAWRASTEAGALSAPAVAGGLVIATARTALVGVDAATGKELWSVPRKLGQLVPPAVAPAAGGGVVVYVEGSTPQDGALVAVDPSTRARLWRVRLGGLPRSAPSIEGDTVFVGSQDRFLYAVTLSSGDLKWRARLDGFVDTSPAVSGDRVFAAGEDPTTGRATFYGLDAETGRRAWTPFLAPPFSIGATTPTVAGDTVYAGFGDLQVRAFDVATGKIRWEAGVRSDSSPVTSPAFADGDLFLVDGTGGLYRIDGRTGDLEWEFQFPSFFIWGSPLVVGDRVFVGAQDGTLAAVDVSTGHRVWQRRVTAPPVGALAAADERLLVPQLGRGGGLLALEHDPAGVVGDVASPTTLRPEVALLNFAAGFAAVLAGGLLLAGAAFRGQRSPNRARSSGHGPVYEPSSERIDR